jgi:hypothetical protein
LFSITSRLRSQGQARTNQHKEDVRRNKQAFENEAELRRKTTHSACGNKIVQQIFG